MISQWTLCYTDSSFLIVTQCSLEPGREFILFSFWPLCVTCRIPWQGIEPRPLSVRVESPNHWIAGDSPGSVQSSHSVVSHSLPLHRPMNTQDWSPLGWTGWTSLQSKGLSSIFSNTTLQKHQFFSAQLYSPTLTSIHDHWKNHSLD